MILGLSTPTFTLIHVVLSLVGIFAGLVVLGGMLRSRRLEGWTAVFLWTTLLTSVTGFFFPFKEILPSHVVGFVSLLALAPALLGLYVYRLAGRWRAIYVATAVFALYLNCFVGVVQAFLKVPLLNALAPTQTELPFGVAQLALLVVLGTLGFRAVRSFHPAAGAAGLRPA